MKISNKFFKFFVHKKEIGFCSKPFSCHFVNGWLSMTGIWGFSGFRRWEIDIESQDWKNLNFGICKFKRLWNDLVFSIEIGIPFLSFSFVITDSRIWDCYEDKPVTWDVYEKLPDRPLKEFKYRYRKQGKEKWYFSSQFLKIYNFDFLNDPWGFTIDLALFPTLLYILFQVGIHQRHSFEFGFSIERENINICITLFSLYLNFEIGKNTVIRQANLKYIEDFRCIINHLGNPYYSNERSENILQKQIHRKNLPFVWEILNTLDVEKFNTDEILSDAAFDDEYNKDIFKLLCEKIGHFDDWEEINNCISLYNKNAIKELKKLPSLYVMLQKQGQDNDFIYCTSDHEHSNLEPHVHICVDANNKNWNGNVFNNEQNLKTIGSVFLPYKQLKNKIPFTPQNIEFETIVDKNIRNQNYIEAICNWLNTEITDRFGNKISNAAKCFGDYELSNTRVKNLKNKLYYFEKQHKKENTLSIHLGKMSEINLRLAHTTPFHLFIKFEKDDFEIESNLSLTRKYYFYFHNFNNAENNKYFELTKDGFSPFILRIFLPLKFCKGLYFELQLTEYHFNVPEIDFNYKKNRPYTIEELILKNEFGKKI